MLGLVQGSNLMSSVVYPPLEVRPHAQDRFSFEVLDSSAEHDPIIGDSFGASEHDQPDYAFCPPDIGLHVEINGSDSELPVQESPFKSKRVFCSFLSKSTSVDSDSDEYPFDAITYGDSVGCFGLPYNDHNYASHAEVTPADDRLTLLAKLALAKGNDRSDEQIVTAKFSGSSSSKPLTTANCPPSVITCLSHQTSERFFQSAPLFTSTASSLSSDSCILKSGSHSLITKASCVSSVANRSLLFQSTHSAFPSPPLQVHRVSSSLTPHIVLRTGVPGLQISTVAPRPTENATVEPVKSVRCVCGLGHADGCVLQCDKCKLWQHADCVSARNGGRSLVPHVCEHCLPRPFVESYSVQRRQWSSVSLANNTSTSASRVTGLCVRNTSDRLVAAAPVLVSDCSTPLQLCVSSVTDGGFTSLPRSADLSSEGTIRFSLVAQAASGTQGQSARNSKRKQDLMTFAGSSPNAGLECMSNSSDSEDKVAHDFPVTSITHDFRHSVITDSSECAKHGVGSLAVSGQSTKVGGPLHNLIHDRQLPDVNHLNELTGSVRYTSPSSPALSSDSVGSPQSETYEEIYDLRFSERFYQKLGSLFSSSLDELPGYLCDDSSLELSRLRRCKVVNFDFNRKGLVASDDLSPRDPVIEYRGLCMLISEYNELYDYRKHYNPYVVFYKNWSKLPLCVDARKCGNDARFIRRSCTPNCEIRHLLSAFHDPVSGPHVRIRLMISTTRAVSRSVELTLPFDFDYTACRYLVRCACSRKTCPVGRWFRQLNQFDTSDSRISTSSSGSLLYSRKLVHSNRVVNGQRGSHPSTASNKDNYSDILTDEFGQRDFSGSVHGFGDCLGLNGLESLDKIRPRHTFRHSTVKKGPGIRKGKDSAPPNESVSDVRGRYGKKLRVGCERSMLRNRYASVSRGRRKYFRNAGSVERKRYRKRAFVSVDDADELNANADPEVGEDRSFELHTVLTTAFTDTQLKECTRDASRKNSVIRAGSKSSSERDSAKLMKSKRSSPRTRNHRQRRLSNDSAQDGNKSKTREEIWMSEVLRRIERMEKKQLQIKQRNQQSPVLSSLDSSATMKESDVARLSPLARLESDEESTSLRHMPSESLTPGAGGSGTLDFELKSLLYEKPLETESLSVTDQGAPCGDLPDVTTDISSVEQGASNCANLLQPIEFADRTSMSPFPASPVEQSVVNCKSPTSVIGRRRRSQTARISYVSGNSASKEGCESREDRWLKSQLRRIAELEARSPTPLPIVSSQSEQPNMPASLVSSPLDTSPLKEVSNTENHVPGSPAIVEACSSHGSVDLHEKFSAGKKAVPSISVNVTSNLPSQHSIRKRIGRSKARKLTPKLAETNTDCELIVYRIQDRDPLARFSRSRSSVDTALPMASVSQENMPPNHDAPNDSIVPPTGSSFTNSPAHATPRPTKKRWLCQALMEEDHEMLTTDYTATNSVSNNRVAPTNSDEPVKSPCTSRPTSSVTAINPKKRIISQLSEEKNESTTDSNSVKELNTLPTDKCQPTHESWQLSQTQASTVSCASSLKNDSGNCESRSTPLPPKKATVRRQSEEMRKVRVSLSEYRRRRGLPCNNNTSASSNKHSDSTGGVLERKSEGDSLPKLMSPNRLLDEIPKLYQQLRLPEKICPQDAFSRHTSKSVTLSNGVNLGPGLDGFTDQSACAITEDEGGPRTPSEPLDEDDGEFANTVYAHRVSGLDSITEECDHSVDKSHNTTIYWSSRSDRSTSSSSVKHSSVEARLDKHADSSRPSEVLPPCVVGGPYSSYAPAISEHLSCSNSHHQDPPLASTCSSPSYFAPGLSVPSDVYGHHSVPHRRHSSSVDNGPVGGFPAMDYYIKRDQRIRHWQEAQSLGWDRWRSGPKHHFNVHHSNFYGKNSHSRHSNKQSTASVHDSSDRTSRLLDVEVTLNRLHECLRTQLDRARQAINPHNPTGDYSHLRSTSYDVFVNRNNSRLGRVTPYAEEKFSDGFSYT